MDLKKDLSGKSRGFCFIVFKVAASRLKALHSKTDHFVKGKKVHVMKARAKVDKVAISMYTVQSLEIRLVRGFVKYASAVV